MNDGLQRARQRFLATLEIVRRELVHLKRSRDRLADRPLDAAWVGSLEENFDDADRLEAFVSRYGRLQDTIGARLIPGRSVRSPKNPAPRWTTWPGPNASVGSKARRRG